MRDLNHLRDLLAHAAWADACFYGRWEASGQLGDTPMRERAAHIAGTQAFFLDVLLDRNPLPWADILAGRVPPPWKDKPLPDFHGLRAWAAGLYEELAELVLGLDDLTGQRLVTIPWFQVPPCVIPVAEALVQVVLHTHHHRAQNITRLKELGGQPEDVDYIIWRWKGAPAAQWR